MKKQNLINATLTTLIGKNVFGIVAQIRNPKYLCPESPMQWRVLKRIETFRENGKHWVQLYWERQSDDSCDFTGCTIESDACVVQFTPEELSKLNKQSMQKLSLPQSV